MKKQTPAKLKKNLDAIFSKYIRAFYSVNGICTCYTCGKQKPIKEIQNGHFIPRNILITRWDENNCRPQCVGCNMFGGGKILDFEDHLVKDLGREKVDQLKASRFKIFKVDSIWYANKISEYEEKINSLQMP